MLFALYALLRDPARGLVIGIADSAEQANIIYRRALLLIGSNPALASMFAKLTETRGLKTKAGAVYELKASKAAALQGLAITVGVVDELHLLKSSLWDSLVSGAGGRPNALVVGITTAGDTESELLLQLYANGEKALAGDADYARFGFFVWEAPEAARPTDRDQFIEYLKASNPSLAEGRKDEETLLADLMSKQPLDLIRYHLNRFTVSEDIFMPLPMWGACAAPFGQLFPAGREVISVDVDPAWKWATISRAIKDGETTHTKLVASIANPTMAQLARACMQLASRSPVTFVMEGYQLKALGIELKQRGLNVSIIGTAELINACSIFYAKVSQKALVHYGDALLTAQLPNAIRVNRGSGFRILPRITGQDIEAVMSTVLAVYAAETTANQTTQGVF